MQVFQQGGRQQPSGLQHTTSRRGGKHSAKDVRGKFFNKFRIQLSFFFFYINFNQGSRGRRSISFTPRTLELNITAGMLSSKTDLSPTERPGATCWDGIESTGITGIPLG